MVERVLECSFLVPILRDSKRDSKPESHDPILWRLLDDALREAFTGRSGPRRIFAYRTEELIPGDYSEPDTGRRVEDESRLYTVAIPTREIDRLRVILRTVANSFDQQSIYLSVAGVVEYIEATEEDGFLS